jgi:AcrR family transcriptional regulator
MVSGQEQQEQQEQIVCPQNAATFPDYRSRPRRRGAVLCQAIFTATLMELAECGYSELTMERVAERARSSKASLYRRWPGRAELVAAAISHILPNAISLPDSGSLREDLRIMLRQYADLLDGPIGQAVRGLTAETLRDPDLARSVRAHITDGHPWSMLALLQRAVSRDQARPQVATDLIASIGPCLVRQRFLTHGAPVPDEVLTEIVDEVLLPLVHKSDGG